MSKHELAWLRSELSNRFGPKMLCRLEKIGHEFRKNKKMIQLFFQTCMKSSMFYMFTNIFRVFWYVFNIDVWGTIKLSVYPQTGNLSLSSGLSEIVQIHSKPCGQLSLNLP